MRSKCCPKPREKRSCYVETGCSDHRSPYGHWARNGNGFCRGRRQRCSAGRREEDGKTLEKELRELGADAEFVKVDVRHEPELQSLVDETVRRFGRLDVAVNNAGTDGAKGPVTSQTAETYASTFETNVLGVLLSMKHELRVMLPQGKGSIINISSVLGHEGVAGHALYVASKHAVEGLTKSAALEVAGTGVRVNIVAPGPVDTGMLNRFTGTPEAKAALASGVPIGRIGQPGEVAAAVEFLASDRASFITGHSLLVDGGKLAGRPAAKR
jgi:NAD(P)-dependent dehydrogenase (short-subunit alcohol dehydrogenase family)